MKKKKRYSLRDKIVKMIDELEQIIVDMEYWNQLNPKAKPLDVEPERVALSMCQKCLRAWHESRKSINANMARDESCAADRRVAEETGGEAMSVKRYKEMKYVDDGTGFVSMQEVVLASDYERLVRLVRHVLTCSGTPEDCDTCKSIKDIVDDEQPLSET